MKIEKMLEELIQSCCAGLSEDEEKIAPTVIFSSPAFSDSLL
jgi:hypothetical protein